MKAQILEGTFAEVQRQFEAMHLEPELRLRVVVTEAEIAESPPAFTATEFWNGIPLLPRRKLPGPITLDLINHLSEDDNEEIVDANRAPGR